MIQLKYNTGDLRYIFVYGTEKDDSKNLSKLEKYLNQIPSYMFLPSFSGIPKPEVFLQKFRKGEQIYYYCSSGLWKEVCDFFKKNNIIYNGLSDDVSFKYKPNKPSQEQFEKWVEGLNLQLKPRPYQVEAARLILNYRMSLSQLATRAGKTLIAYLVFRWMMEMEGAHNILMIVPNTSLVKQGVSDMDEYAPFFKSESVWSGGELCEGSNLTIGTFQSLVKRVDKKSSKYDPKFFDKYDVICCDECHTAKCKSIQMILSQNFMKNLKLKFGFSGTLPVSGSIESFCVQSLLGPCIQDISSKELQDEGFIAKAKVHQIRMEHPWTDDLKKTYIRCGEYLTGNWKLDPNGKKIPLENPEFTMTHLKTMPVAVQEAKANASSVDEYIDFLVDLCKAQGSNLLMLEQMLVHRDKKRLGIIRDLLEENQGNCIFFAHHTEYIKFLEKWLKENCPSREVRVITGGTSVKKRKAIQDEMLERSDIVLLASYACVGTGLTFKNVDFGIFGQSFKSQIINKQAIGRGLLKTESKDTFLLYDLVDIFPTKRLYQHGREKEKLWKKEGFEFEYETM